MNEDKLKALKKENNELKARLALKEIQDSGIKCKSCGSTNSSVKHRHINVGGGNMIGGLMCETCFKDLLYDTIP